MTVDEVRANMGLPPIEKVQKPGALPAQKYNPNHLGAGPGGGQFTTNDRNGTSNGLPPGSGDPRRSSIAPPSRAADSGTQVAQVLLSPVETMIDAVGGKVSDIATPEGAVSEVSPEGSATETRPDASAPTENGQPPAQPYDWQLGDYKSAQRWQNQMEKGNWTPDQIDNIINNGDEAPAPNDVNPKNSASRFTDPETGRYVVRDNVTKDILQVSRPGFIARELP